MLWDFWIETNVEAKNFLWISDCDCQTIMVNLTGDAFTYQGERHGYYQKSAKVNGKTSWISSKGVAVWFTNALPYYPG